jgi:mRNA-degrading endonuclease RelE of RelBE toxin-antitoxin system
MLLTKAPGREGRGFSLMGKRCTLKLSLKWANLKHDRESMAFKITITEEADRQLRVLTARQQRILEAAILSRLQHDPTTPTRAIKRLRPNPLVEFELRAGDLRALYNVEEDEVVILIVGVKVGNKLIVEGEEFHGHQDDPPEPPGNGSNEDAQ